MGTIRDVPSITCAAVDFLNISANISNYFKSSIPGDGKGDTSNGFLSTLLISMSAFVARYFDDKYVNWHCCGKTPLCHLNDLLTSC